MRPALNLEEEPSDPGDEVEGCLPRSASWQDSHAYDDAQHGSEACSNESSDTEDSLTPIGSDTQSIGPVCAPPVRPALTMEQVAREFGSMAGWADDVPYSFDDIMADQRLSRDSPLWPLLETIYKIAKVEDEFDLLEMTLSGLYYEDASVAFRVPPLLCDLVNIVDARLDAMDGEM